MKTAYLDTIGGIAGDMTLAAFVGAGVRLDDLTGELGKLPVRGYELIGKHVSRNGIDAMHIDVVVSGDTSKHRHLGEIKAILNESSLSDGVKEKAKSIFDVLAGAEARVHNTTPEKIHFHEVGAIDAIIDIAGTAICLEALNIEEVYTSPIKVGNRGLIEAEHGLLPTPAPATAEILKGYPLQIVSIPHEMTTPTGAAIVKALSSGVLDEGELTISAIGYGAGKADFGEVPNLLRVIIGETGESSEHDEIVVVETNIDDMSPEIYPYVIEKLLVSGAQDAYLIPTIMKKGRPGILLSALVDRAKLDAIVQCIHSETSTIGVRFRTLRRNKLPREQRTITTSLGPVTVKVILHGGKETVAPEYEECRRIAEERNLPLIEVYKIINRETSAS